MDKDVLGVFTKIHWTIRHGRPSYVKGGYQRYDPSLRITRRQGGGRVRRTQRDYVNRKGTLVRRRKDFDGERVLRIDGLFPEQPRSVTVQENVTSRPIYTIAPSRLFYCGTRRNMDALHSWLKSYGWIAERASLYGSVAIETDCPVNKLPVELARFAFRIFVKGFTKGTERKADCAK